MYLTRTDNTGFWQFLDSIDQKYEKSDFPFLTNEDPPRIKPVFDFGEFLSLLSKDEAQSYLYHGLGHALSYVGPVLDSELEHGFNDHTDRHTSWVARNTVDLLQRSGTNYDGTGSCDSQTEILATLVGLTHDIGNLISRKKHSDYSQQIITELFYHEENHAKLWSAAIQAITFHDEAALKTENFNLSSGLPLLWALVLADKMHAGRDRLGDKSLLLGPKGSLDADIHILLNSLIAHSCWYISLDKFIWHLDFSVDINLERLKPLANQKERIWVPQKYQEDFRNHKIAYRDNFAKDFVEIYLERIKLCATTVNLLFPWLSGFQLVLNDSDPRQKVGPVQIVIYSS